MKETVNEGIFKVNNDRGLVNGGFLGITFQLCYKYIENSAHGPIQGFRLHGLAKGSGSEWTS